MSELFLSRPESLYQPTGSHQADRISGTGIGPPALLPYHTAGNIDPSRSLLRNSFTQINRQIRSDIRKARELSSSGKSLLRVGFLSSLSRKDIILPITDFLMQHCPELALDIRLLDFVALRNQLLDQRLDLCITTSNDWRFWPGIHTTVLQQKQFQVVYSARHPLGKKRKPFPFRTWPPTPS